MDLNTHPEFLAMTLRLEAMKRETDKLRAEREAEEKRAAEKKAAERKVKQTAALDAALAKHLPASKAKVARALLTHPDAARISYDDGSDEVLFIDSYGLPQPLDVGIRSWLRSDEGKALATPSSAPSATPSTGDPLRGAIRELMGDTSMAPLADGEDPRERLRDAVKQILASP